jgi:hypothetical protein
MAERNIGQHRSYCSKEKMGERRDLNKALIVAAADIAHKAAVAVDFDDIAAAFVHMDFAHVDFAHVDFDCMDSARMDFVDTDFVHKAAADIAATALRMDFAEMIDPDYIQKQHPDSSDYWRKDHSHTKLRRIKSVDM